ncbi:hypothetical protein B0T10DRAFT_553786 [Thelonectria olida]|uniref:FluG domain-containing protein n=1 Tax=Thelonectria olida TaxID=1576542 RepID=A0A9P8VNJ3_9HYPO|nr:hypothetical protein B0T10DRAFT_553786 [Thelonectria olida]
MTFLEWMLDTYKRVRKQSSVRAYERILFQVYRKSVGHGFDKMANEEINDVSSDQSPITSRRKSLTSYVQYINGYLTIRYELNTSAYTATRPRVLVYKPLSKAKIRNHYFGWENEDAAGWEHAEWDPEVDDFKTISYRDVKLFLLKGPDGKRDLPAMEVTLRYTKGWERRENPKTFLFYEVDDLLFDALILMLAIAMLDEAFDAGITSVEDFYRIRVRPPRRSVEFDWKEDILNTPIFRQPVRMNDGTIRTSDTEALRYHTYLYYLQRLGLVTGFLQILSPYTIRRGSGEAVEAAGTQGQLQQVMCNISAATYQADINQWVQLDLTAAFLGRPSESALMKAASHMSRFVDPRAPTTASPEELDKLKTDPGLSKLINLRDMLSEEVRRESGTIRDAQQKETKLYEMYHEADNQVRSARSYIRKLATTRTRENFFNTINTLEINAQLKGEKFLDLGQGSWRPQPSYSLKERKMVAELICADRANLDDEMMLKHRICSVHALVTLGKMREPRPVKVTIDKPVKFPTECGKDQCFFCFWDEKRSINERLRKFCSIYRARDQLVSHHLRTLRGHSFLCPDPNCTSKKIKFRSSEAFQSHVTREHGYDIFNSYKTGSAMGSNTDQRRENLHTMTSCRGHPSMRPDKMEFRIVRLGKVNS